MNTLPGRLAAVLGSLAALVAAGCAEMPDRMNAGNVAPRGAPPAPRSVTTMTPGLARIAIRDTLQKRHLYQRAAVKPDLFVDEVPGKSYYETKNLRVTAESLAFDYDEDETFFKNGIINTIGDVRRNNHHVDFRFASEGYCTGVREDTDSRVRYFTLNGFAHQALFAWQAARDARLFCDAWNNLVDQARRGNGDDMLVFAANARSWREHPESRPPEPPGLDRERILAENSYRERDLFGALEHFEAGLKLHPAWQEGWFNAALLYEALGEYEYAASRMRHYLELAPNAPDARDARAKLVVWQEKMRRQ